VSVSQTSERPIVSLYATVEQPIVFLPPHSCSIQTTVSTTVATPLMTDATAPRSAPPHLPTLSARSINPMPCPLLSHSSSVFLSLTATAHFGSFRASRTATPTLSGCAPPTSFLLAQPPCYSPPQWCAKPALIGVCDVA
jgi:hypothetical protein